MNYATPMNIKSSWTWVFTSPKREVPMLIFKNGNYFLGQKPAFRVAFHYPDAPRTTIPAVHKEDGPLWKWCEENVGKYDAADPKWEMRSTKQYADYFFISEHDALMFKMCASDLV